MRIKDVLQSKTVQELVTISPEADVRTLLGLLAEYNIGAVVVSSDGEQVEGIVSERDVVRHLHADPASMDGPVRALMTNVVHTTAPDNPLPELMQVMTEHRIRHVPVLTDGTLTGVVSIGDVVKHRIDELQFERDQLDHYVHQT